jgi:hypothetical protein
MTSVLVSCKVKSTLALTSIIQDYKTLFCSDTVGSPTHTPTRIYIHFFLINDSLFPCHHDATELDLKFNAIFAILSVRLRYTMIAWHYTTAYATDRLNETVFFYTLCCGYMGDIRFYRCWTETVATTIATIRTHKCSLHKTWHDFILILSESKCFVLQSYQKKGSSEFVKLCFCLPSNFESLLK